MLLPEGADLVAVAGEQGRRHQLSEAQHKEFLRRIAYRGRIIDDERAVFRQQLEKMGRRDVGHVEWRVLSHQDDVEPGKVELFEGAETMVIAVAAGDLEPPTAGIEPPIP